LVDLGFLSVNRKERAIFDGLLLLLGIAERAVAAFEECAAAVAKGERSRAEELVAKVFEEETHADTVHRELSLKVAEGAFFGGVREDILDLLEKIDDIADSAKDAARFLESESRLGEDAHGILASENMKLFLGDLKFSVQALAELVRTFERGKKEVLSKVHSVEEYEEFADSRKDALLKELFDQAGSMSPVSVIQLRDFIFVADDIADNAEDAGDVILVLIAKGYG
jgi:predicted phosphate transport protein (TIGR00153 family)